MKVRLWFKGKETELARLYSKIPSSRHPTKADEVWLPRDRISHTQKFPAKPGEEWPEHVVDVEEWLAIKENL